MFFEALAMAAEMLLSKEERWLRWGHFILIPFNSAFCNCKLSTVCGEIRVCGAAMAYNVKFNVSFLSILSWFSLSDVTDGLGTGKIIIYWV